MSTLFNSVNSNATRVAALPFDKLDVEKGMEISDPVGNVRWLKQPWSVLAWQIAGAHGLELILPRSRPHRMFSHPGGLWAYLLDRRTVTGWSTLLRVQHSW